MHVQPDVGLDAATIRAATLAEGSLPPEFTLMVRPRGGAEGTRALRGGREGASGTLALNFASRGDEAWALGSGGAMSHF